ncbi:non-ribosomal peptide synthetase [Chamaesiphon minutus]|uniref:Amino acid adenylation enzyme/thioester reductase family protein n=1 Tax=Chamaesiphon minutus (strain ATCC 27169 / PCC 6605) TaxID=1173020 RepID=K9UBW2_CHAP6|nr:non-ribosomal peptide synthetase [Chamaesiphon minutus]AFY92128.1 amino acid adenylation enzyme/thioester reductase family protein [Chamaesiphon minutus PCC 6605]
MFSEEVFVFPASFAQQRLWFLDRAIPDNAIYNVPTAIHLAGSLNLAALERTFNEIVRRHETLRTTFIVEDGQPLQAILPSATIPVHLVALQHLGAKERDVRAKSIINNELKHAFDLASGALLRVTILVLSDTEHILLINMHHIICDDWSLGVLIGELGTLYAAFDQNLPSPLSELPLQYADFAQWQREWLQGVVLDTQLAYWREQLNGISTLHLPTDKPRSAIQNYRGAARFLELPKQLTDCLEQLSQQAGATLFMTLLAAFKTLLYRYTDREDITIGSPIANRNRSEIEGIIGFFVNSLVLRSDLAGNPTFRELLDRVRAVTVGAYTHQDLPFEKLVSELHPERSLSHHPLFQVVFGFQNSPMCALELPGLVPSLINIEFKTTRFDLELHLWKCDEDFRSLDGDNWEDNQGLRGVIVYNTDLFEPATIDRMQNHFQTLLSGIVANPDRRIANLPLLSDLELNRVVVAWNHTQVDNPETQCIHRIFETKMRQYPNAIALNFANDRITYRELNARSNQLARYLQKLGVGVEVLVGICIPQSIDTIVGLLAILKVGGAYVPLDPSYPQERLNFMLEDAKVAVLLTQSNSIDRFKDFKNPLVLLDNDWETIGQERADNLQYNVNSDNLAYVIYTSGSTGQPKGVAVAHKAINRLVCNPNYIKLEPGDRVAQAANISFDAATFEIWGALLNGAELVAIGREVTLSPREFALEIRDRQIDILFLTTALFQQIARDVPQAFETVKYLLFGGETVDVRWVNKIIEHGAPQHLIHVYGPTENTTFSTYYDVDLSRSISSLPIGRPITNTQIYILDPHLQPLPIGVTGEIYLGGDGLARGYLDRPKLTERAFIDRAFDAHLNPRLYKTGDRARYLPDGNVEFLGRNDNLVKIRGFRIELAEIEAVLNQHLAVSQNVVIVAENVPDDRQLVAYIILDRQQKPTPEIHSFRQFLSSKLPLYMVPTAYIFLEYLPLTPNGKVDRAALPTPDLSNYHDRDYVPPRSQVEELLTKIWAKILGKEQIGIHDNFFESGGHSLLATQLMSRIRDNFQVDLPVSNLFEAPTIAQLARYIDIMCWAANVDETETTGLDREEVEFRSI